ncbi:MAG: hypothetical protein HDS58_03480 [Barnesiella sp.]|nr:hypothetical protein [Barnesiella sp.]MBD5246239.1 hypothetical protein [Barnesiella sp.]MBD5249139.1 hypothetical protein [Barnesiella sp.]
MRVICIIAIFVISAINFSVYSRENNSIYNRYIEIETTIVDSTKVEAMLYNLIDSISFEMELCIPLLKTMGDSCVSDSASLKLISDAYEYHLKYRYNLSKLNLSDEEITTTLAYLFSGLHITQFPDQNLARKLENMDVKNGEITEDTKTYLIRYARKLLFEVSDIEKKIKNKDYSLITPLPTKKSFIRADNPNYFGKFYSNAKKLDELEFNENIKGWEFLTSSERTFKKLYYPDNIGFYIYPQIPNYRVIGTNINDITVYDKNGKLIYVPVLDRSNYGVIAEIKRLIYLRAYNRNTYNIQSESSGVHKYIKYCLDKQNVLKNCYGDRELDPGSGRGSVRIVYDNACWFGDCDQRGKLFLKQIRRDFSSQFGFLYEIKRISNTKFRIIYLNGDTLKPSICAIVSYYTGDKPYTTCFSVELTKIPNNIPPVAD